MQRIAAKWLLAILTALSLGLILLGVASYQVITNHYRQYAASDLLARSRSYAEILSVDWDEKTLQHVAGMERHPDGGVYVFSAEGRLLSASVPAANRSEVLEAARRFSREGGRDPVREEKWNSSSVMLTKSSIRQDKAQLGTVVVFSELKWLESTLVSLRSLLFLAGIGALSVAGGTALLLSRRIVRPILEIREIAGRLSRGDYEARVPVRGRDELASLAERMNELAESLAYYSSSRRKFLSHVAHELRTPLTYVKGYVTLLREQDIQGQEAQKLLSVIREQTDRLERLVGDLVTLSHLDEGELKVRRERFDLRRHLRRIAEEVAPRAEERGIRLDWEVRGEGEVFLDPDRLDQILLNLLDNALRYSRRGGQVRVTGIIDREKNRVRIDVADEGIGIPKEELKRIWDRFYRVEKSRARRFGGSGLGLSIVKQLTDLLGGSVEVHSEPGKGTTFVLTFPLNGPEGEKKGSR